jgi:hypothetical protein
LDRLFVAGRWGTAGNGSRGNGRGHAF